MPPRPPSREREAFDREGGEPITERRASGDARANIAAILSGGDKESALSPFAFRAGYAFSAASAPSSPAGADLLAARRSAWATQSASRAERYRKGESTRGLETPPRRRDSTAAAESPSHGADPASAFGAVVATLESAKKLMVGAEASIAAGSPSAFASRAARSTPGASAPRALNPAAAAAALGSSAAKRRSRSGKETDAAAGAPRRALRWAEGGRPPGSDPIRRGDHDTAF